MLLAIYATCCETARAAENGVCFPPMPLLGYPVFVLVIKLRVEEFSFVFRLLVLL